MKLSDLKVRTDIKEAIVRSVKCLAEHANGDRSRRPPLDDPASCDTSVLSPGKYPELYWGADCLADGTGRFGPPHRRHALDTGVAHVVGRAIWALLLAEETVGVRPPDETMEILTRYCRDMYDNPDHLGAFIDPDRDFRRFIVCHDIREGFLGLLAMARVRGDAWAGQEAQRVLSTLERITGAQGHLSLTKAREAGMGDRLLGAGNDATTSGRLVGPLVEYYQFSKDPRALRLAQRYATATMTSTFTPDGRFQAVESSSGHVHSITSSLCGITRYALFANDAEMIEQCRRIMDEGIPQYASSWGWVDEVMPRHPANEIGRGEINQTGDVIRTALLLGEAGYHQYYERAERFLRSTLLPVQHRTHDLQRFLKLNDSPQGDWERDVSKRVVGGYSMFLPNDRMRPGHWPLTTQDIISGAVHALCECWRYRCTVGSDSVRLNLLLDYEDNDVVIKSQLPLQGRVFFRSKAAKTLWIRVPDWVDVASLRLTVEKKAAEVVIRNGYVEISGLTPEIQGSLDFPIPCKVEVEIVDGTEYTTTWIGNQLIEIQPPGAVSPLPF
ncbi:MAG: hypothetical protein HQ582_30530 [Planctomycetes bacterium]|nr:hypothetical protein [Planctomycetota bacterium]